MISPSLKNLVQPPHLQSHPVAAGRALKEAKERVCHRLRAIKLLHIICQLGLTQDAPLCHKT